MTSLVVTAHVRLWPKQGHRVPLKLFWDAPLQAKGVQTTRATAVVSLHRDLIQRKLSPCPVQIIVESSVQACGEGLKRDVQGNNLWNGYIEDAGLERQESACAGFIAHHPLICMSILCAQIAAPAPQSSQQSCQEMLASLLKACKTKLHFISCHFSINALCNVQSKRATG